MLGAYCALFFHRLRAVLCEQNMGALFSVSSNDVVYGSDGGCTICAPKFNTRGHYATF